MKVALYLVVILIAAVNTALAGPGPYQDCVDKCVKRIESNEEPIHKQIRVCAESGAVYDTRCNFDCAKLDPELKPEDYKEAECKPGSQEHCWNTECTEEERKSKRHIDEIMCAKDPPHQYTTDVCVTKCWAKAEQKKDVEFVSCKQFNLEKLENYGS